MPQNRFLTGAGGSQDSPRTSGNRFLGGARQPESTVDYEPEVSEETLVEEDSGPGLGTAAAGVAGVGGLAALLSRAPGTVGRIAKAANSLRSQLMLTGFAPAKSLLGNVGAATERAIETGSLNPLRQLLSGETVSDAIKAWRAGGVSSGVRGADQAIGQGGNALTRAAAVVSPGRFMGALDEATQGALRRSGALTDEAANATLQTPLGTNLGRLGEILEGPTAQYLHPFRRTPFNQFIEGLQRLPGGSKGSTRAKLIYGGAGLAHGAATAEDDLPLSIPLASAASARYGLPYAVAALVGRGVLGGRGGGGIAGSVLPVSEYGYEQSLTDPLRPFRQPAALSALDRLAGRQ